ncbi:hypothetical protein A2331_00895 [Candidatus Falkowbacteria bacterium RIFOXYB2_FULL_34_18]|uniref:Uncharacterized protein n=1 Tax=Candidatus Falkowbacteria bacterium RIFOXYD2_FULL_34_120 TaxID=1798007 RepID=A0A1F5TTK6_9BACT|nr:MAG: hypothetical protein A2331_00895 [Candidatus Falkowbacteria bacterium RIFOXYB2_FULL_34_18]OGF30196.1 MAG: hypothetical protein A2500_02215 [Candidatus Falkowbacteria bacterium RIFOXYC12_FULL_34_55]OGF37655.1 MAG: hypothetical protein A2466_05450 [Candidatus Falkowbacteria bacterium RIFOXYC2_FULL_34_220]OGF39382.1 MAG: hypothetical protein A2515_02680 [Candidatus Falkowbacteria bacterium RIFOXYD12_FULL_34_57]OGF41911.1 MAG: hypothetical protein A2531_04745 [Candidatus Falkowbacteria bact
MLKEKKHKQGDILESINKATGPIVSVLQKEPGIKDVDSFEKRIEKLRAKGKFFNKIYSTSGVLVVIFFAVVCAALGYYFYYADDQASSLDFVKVFKEKYQCRMDMRVCTDGSIVNRIPPECDFADCPGVLGLSKLPKIEPTDKLDFRCDTDIDCSKYISTNSCQMFCANQNQNNENIISKLKKTCDASLWDPSAGLNCKCINNKCSFNYK